jgi:outer membrane immunogenic protein
MMRAEHGLAGLLAAGLTLGAMQAHADDKSGFYIGAGILNANLQDSVGNGEAGHINFDSDANGFKLLAGYMFLDWLGVELAYENLGSPDDDANVGLNHFKLEASDISAVTGSLLAQIPLGPVDIFGKVGVVSYNTDIKATLVGVGKIGKENVDGEELAAGGGVAFNIGAFAIRGEYEYFDVKDGVDVWSLSAIWHL